MSNLVTFNVVPLGSVVAVNPARFPLVQHVGIVTGYDRAGMPYVTHNSFKHGDTRTESLAEFAGGQPVTVLPRQSALPPQLVARRALEKVGTAWNLFSWNCEHFVRYAQGLSIESGQLQAAFVGIGLASLASLFLVAD